MLRDIAVSWQKMQGGVRVIKVTGAPRVSYWELKTPSGNSLGFSPANTLGILTFDTSFADPARLFPVTLRGTGYREGISIGIAQSVSSGGSPSYTVTPPAMLSGLINTASGSFSIVSSGITTPTLITMSSSLAGTFSTSSITLPIGSATQSFTYTPTIVGNHIISFGSTLTNPSPVNYVANSTPPPSGGNLILDTQFVTLAGPLTIPLAGASNYIIRHVTTTASSGTINFSGTPTQDLRVEIWNRSEPGRIVSVQTPPDGLAVAALNTGLGESKLTLDYDLTSNTWYGVITNG